MALSLDDIKKNKVTRKARKKPIKASHKKATTSRTKPWEKPQETIEATYKELPIDDLDILKKALDWSKKIKLFPEIDIPIPEFLLTKDKD